MARRTTTVTIPQGDDKNPNRDKGKAFLLTEMSADHAARWALKAITGMIKAGAEIPDSVVQAGMAGVASLGLRAMAGMDFNTLDGLLLEMQQCIQIIPTPANPSIVRPLMVDDDIEEVETLMKLRLEVFALHTGFSWADLKQMLSSAMTTNTTS